jgi:hypothetical protein
MSLKKAAAPSTIGLAAKKSAAAAASHARLAGAIVQVNAANGARGTWGT